MADVRRQHVLDNGICTTCEPHVLDNGECLTCADDEPDGPLDEQSQALLTAISELVDRVAARAFDPSKHPRNPKGSPGGGRFRSMVDRLKDAIEAHRRGEGKGHPFDGFDREQLRRVAKARGIELKRGEGRDSIARKLEGHLGDGSAKSKADAPGPEATSRPVSRITKGRDRLDSLAGYYRGDPVEYEGRRRKVYDTPYDKEMALIAETQDFEGKPQVVTRRRLDDAVAAGWVETWRGVTDSPDGRTAADINGGLRSGRWEPGRGLYGNGMYVSVRRNTAETFRGHEPKTNYPSVGGPDFGPEDFEGSVGADSMLRIALDPKARIADFDTLRKEQQAWLAALPDHAAERAVFADIGRYAAARGYDGMIVRNRPDGSFYPGWETAGVDVEDVERFPQADQYVIFNRTALMIQRREDEA